MKVAIVGRPLPKPDFSNIYHYDGGIKSSYVSLPIAVLSQKFKPVEIPTGLAISPIDDAVRG